MIDVTLFFCFMSFETECIKIDLTEYKIVYLRSVKMFD